jgi:hypothetical protein
MQWGRVAWGLLLLGLALVAFGAAFAVSHYVFGVQIHEGHSGRLATGAEILTNVIAFGAGGGLFALLGAAILLRRGGK